MSVYLQRSASIQLRTSPNYEYKIYQNINDICTPHFRPSMLNLASSNVVHRLAQLKQTIAVVHAEVEAGSTYKHASYLDSVHLQNRDKRFGIAFITRLEHMRVYMS